MPPKTPRMMMRSTRCTWSAERNQRGTRRTGRRPKAIRIIATSAPARRAAATFAENAIAPNIVAEANMKRRARCVSFFGNVNWREAYQMDDLAYRDGARADAAAIVEFQRAMARETEELELDAVVVTSGVHGVFDDPS